MVPIIILGGIIVDLVGSISHAALSSKFLLDISLIRHDQTVVHSVVKTFVFCTTYFDWPNFNISHARPICVRKSGYGYSARYTQRHLILCRGSILQYRLQHSL